MSGAERRRHQRVAVDVPATLRAGGGDHSARIRDICRDAVLVEADEEWPLETEVSLRTDLPGVSDPIDVRGRVIRLAPGEDGGHGMAILFSDMSPVVAMRIDFFVALQADLGHAGAARPDPK